MKNVLLLGDSIRMQYQPIVKQLLKGRANVYGPTDNGRWTDYTLNSLRFWLPQMPDADIVHWNNGLWDMGDDYQEGFPHRSIKEYESDVTRLFKILRQLISPDVKIIAATTTPTLSGNLEQFERYNAVLRRVAEESGVAVNDLYSAVLPKKEELIGPDKVHMNPDGIRQNAEMVAKAIEPYLD